MKYQYSQHALSELAKRGIDQDIVEAILAHPEQKIKEQFDITCFQSKVRIGHKVYLIRVMVNEIKRPSLVVTVYRTSKIDKYWRKA